MHAVHHLLTFCIVLRILEDNYERFKADMDAGAIAPILMEKGVISRSLKDTIIDARSKEEGNEILYEDVFRYGTQDTLMTVCEVAVTGASEKMIALGQFLVEELERGLLNLDVKELIPNFTCKNVLTQKGLEIPLFLDKHA